MNVFPGLIIIGVLVTGIAIIALTAPRKPTHSKGVSSYEHQKDKDDINKGLPKVKNTPPRWK